LGPSEKAWLLIRNGYGRRKLGDIDAIGLSALPFSSCQLG
jgi:hypothetical protein